LKRQAVFLDRDGVINKATFVNGKHRSPLVPEELEFFKDAKTSIRKLRKLGFLIFIVTNQPEISRGNLRREDSDAINALIGKEIKPDEIVVCPHDDADGCICRKPLPGMITGLIFRYALDPNRCYLVGDRLKDIEAGRAAGVRSIQIDRGYPEGLSTAKVSSAKSLCEAVRIIRKMERRGF
jgi:D-glycero-D-manno-heptose 1,7-bisphosphate phosphatase